MALEDIIKSIQADAEKKISEINGKGKARRQEIEREWEDRILERRKDILDRARMDVERKVHAAELLLKASARERILSAKQELLDAVFSNALRELSALSDAEYVSFMEKLLSQLPVLSGDIISVSGKEGLLKKALEKSGLKLNFSGDTCVGSGGFVVHTSDVRVDNTIESLIDDAKEEMKVEIGRILFT